MSLLPENSSTSFGRSFTDQLIGNSWSPALAENWPAQLAADWPDLDQQENSWWADRASHLDLLQQAITSK
jgi:hypothetical protein